jgi:VCBS repeat-containing protein
VTYQITVSGTMTDALSGLDPSTATYTVSGTLGGSHSGAITVNSDGTYSFTTETTQIESLSTPISIEVSVQDNAGNTGSAVTYLE